MSKVCLLADGPSPHTWKWVTGLAGRGWEIDVITFRPVENGAGIPRVRIHTIPAVTGSSKSDSFLRARWVKRKIKEIKPDIVHSHYATSFGVLGALSGVHPLVVSAWGSDIFSFPRQSFLHRNLLQWVLSRADVLCSTSRIMAEEMGRYIRPGRDIKITPFGVDVTRFVPPADHAGDAGAAGDTGGIPVEESGRPVVFGIAKNLKPVVYGLDILLEGFALLHKSQPGRAILRVAGDGPERESLRSQADRLEISPWIEWAGPLPNDQIAAFYQAVDVVVVPSRQESFGVTAVEGLACGKPVIATKVGGLPEIVIDRESGLLIEPDSPEQLAAAMTALLNDPGLRSQMGRRGREYVLTHYDWQKNITVMEDIYRGMLENNSRK